MEALGGDSHPLITANGKVVLITLHELGYHSGLLIQYLTSKRCRDGELSVGKQGQEALRQITVIRGKHVAEIILIQIIITANI